MSWCILRNLMGRCLSVVMGRDPPDETLLDRAGARRNPSYGKLVGRADRFGPARQRQTMTSPGRNHLPPQRLRTVQCSIHGIVVPISVSGPRRGYVAFPPYGMRSSNTGVIAVVPYTSTTARRLVARRVLFFVPKPCLAFRKASVGSRTNPAATS